jgi:hypothetical protein
MMPVNPGNIRAPVRRQGAQNYLLLSLVSFGGSVMVTRLFLELTGYPKLGGGELHIAHVLWGGLFLFIAALIPLIYANRWAYTAGAVISGIGVGLFIDEVGKFITQSNDYFYPPAAPIIYALFLLTVLIYLRIKRPPAWDARHELYSILDGMSEVLDSDLEATEQAEMQTRLKRIADDADDEALAHLAQALSDYLSSEKIHLVPRRQTHFDRVLTSLQHVESHYFNRSRVRLALILAFAIFGSLSFGDVFTRLLPHGQPLTLEAVIAMNVLRGEVRSLAGAQWFFVHLALQALVSLLAFFSAGLIVSGKEKRGMEIGTVCLVLSLTMVNLLSFFVDQFSASVMALIQLGVLLTLSYYRKRYFHTSLTI